jgi:uncharacterized protein
MTFIIGGFVLGLAASVHCVVMCGPLMMMVLSGRGRRGRAGLFYHAGRLTTYALLGAIAGALGHLAGLAGFSRVLSVVAGLALIWTAARRAGWLNVGGELGRGLGTGLGLGRRLTSALANVTRVMRAKWDDSSPFHLASAGVVNGLLPCGPVYAALTASAALGDSAQSAGFMLAFGAGTLPALAAAGTLAAWTSRISGAGSRWRLVTPVALVLLGILLTARGVMPTHHHDDAKLQPAHHQHGARPAATSDDGLHDASHHAFSAIARQCEKRPPSASATNLISPSKYVF